MISVRHAVDQDKPGLRAMLRAAGWSRLADDLGGPYWQWPAFVAVDGAEVVGVLEGQFGQRYDKAWCPHGHEGPQAWIFHLVTAPDRRHQGVGTALVEGFRTEARVHGCS